MESEEEYSPSPLERCLALAFPHATGFTASKWDGLGSIVTCTEEEEEPEPDGRSTELAGKIYQNSYFLIFSKKPFWKNVKRKVQIAKKYFFSTHKGNCALVDES